MFEILFKSCTHEKVTPHIKAVYCPDCGEYVENHWYISRCKCCGIKQKSFIRNGKVISDAKFCRNCGSNQFAVEELENLDIVNIQYAVFKKQTRFIKNPNIIQTWIEQNTYSPIKLLPTW